MSRTVVYAVWPGKDHDELKEFRNSWGSAPVVWGKVFARYVDSSGHYPEQNYTFRTDELWPLYKRQDIPAPIRRVLMMTYDGAIVGRDHYARAAADIRAFLAAFRFEPECALHWPSIAALFESNPDCPAIGFNWTTVNCNPFQCSYNEETDDFDPPDWDEFWDVYEHDECPQDIQGGV